MMEMKHTDYNGEIVLSNKLDHVEVLFIFNYENLIKKWILQVRRKCLDCPKNKILHNFLNASPNETI